MPVTRCRNRLRWKILMPISCRATIMEFTSSKCLTQSGVLENAVGGVTRDDLSVDRKCRVGDRAIPDFVIALALPDKVTPRLAEKASHLAREVSHDYATINSVCSTVRSSC